MMSLEYIKEQSEIAAYQAAAHNKKPLTLWNPEEIRKIPFLGDYLPHGYNRVEIKDNPDFPQKKIFYNAYFVDSSGFGQEDEAALTYMELIDVLSEINLNKYSFAITESGQFQIRIGVYEKW